MATGYNTYESILRGRFIGNIGSSKRTKYNGIGSHVNLASRIESYTVRGQILISESTLAACGPILRIDKQMDVMPKDVQTSVTIYGIDGHFQYALREKRVELMQLPQLFTTAFTILDGKHADRITYHKENTGMLGRYR